MAEFYTVITRKGQITIPGDIRRHLGLTEGDRIAVVLEGDEVRLARVSGVVARTAGMLKGDEAPLTAEALRGAGEQSIAESAVDRGCA